MKTTSMKSRPRWRVSDEITAELEHARERAGCRSWDEYFALLIRQPNPSVPQEAHPLDDEIRALQQEHQEFRTALDGIRNLLEKQEQAIQVAEQERAETHELLRRIHKVLSLALLPEDPASIQPDDLDDHVRDAVLDSVRRRRPLASMK